ncbi:MAG: glycine--tRNA ligase subunit beta, partial [Nitrospinota bacterium]
MAELLFEVGTEEIPSNFMPGLLEALERLAREGLSERRLAPERLGVLGTPRRLVLFAEGLPGRQAPLSRELLGPPAGVAFDKERRPTRAAEGFARAQGAGVEDLRVKETPKGPYVYLLREDPGAPAREVLSLFLPELIAKLPAPKSMRWGEGSFRFVRPIHWVAALLDGEVIPFELGEVKSGRTSRGHRFMDPAGFEVGGLRDYIEKARRHRVLADPSE